ncbi:BREX-1 system phosphatase PglZ type A [Epilithonimonas tenax]|uniref:BREX-1 system phosphatase PglZ type A n=1 Tax=Epilithonimonas tenax TaxID=191577 RepID=UPI00042343BE|nr:BREX-1 system phosphatase PglZ type A [Epilithonimonas tenax]
MITEKIKQKFSEIDYPILFLFDADKEYEEELMSYDQSDFKIVTVDRNFFAVKHAVEFKEKSDKILLYHLSEEPKEKEYINYPLTDLLLAGNILAMDEISDLLHQYKIPLQQRENVGLVKKWIKAKKNQSKILPALTNKPFEISKLYTAVVSIILEEKKTGNIAFNLIRIFEILQEGQTAWEKKQQILVNAGLDETVKLNIAQLLSIEAEDLRFDTLKNLWLQLKYNLLTAPIAEAEPIDVYKTLKIKDDTAKIKITNFFKDWQDDKNKSLHFETIFDELGASINEEKIYQWYGSAQEYGIRTKKIVQSLLSNSLKEILINPSEIVSQYASFNNNSEQYEGYEQKVSFILNTARFFEMIRRYSDFVFNKPQEYIQRYEKELYKLDGFYRVAFTAYQQFSEEMLSDYETVFAELNKTYDQYLIDVNNPWVKSLDEIGFDFDKLTTAKQFNFYNDFVAPITNKKVVIISDAFRYELGIELMNELKVESDNNITCSAMLASIPSYTNLGMSNLLPNKTIGAIITDENIDYSIAEIKTVSTNREQILKLAESNSGVIDYATFSKFNTEEGRNYLRDKHTVYVYHNWMDAIGDKQGSEYYTFESAEQCITQLKTLIRKLYGNFNIYNVLVTADHGFLFNYKKISDATSQQLPVLKNTLKDHTRFCLTTDTNDYADTYQFPLSATTNIVSEVQVILPKAINRFRKKGNIGKQFVHGGGALQEVIVPVLQLYRNRRNLAKKVNFKRIDTIKSVSTSFFKLNFLQVEPIGTDYKSRILRVAIYDIDNQIISNEEEVILNLTSELPAERSFEVRMELSSKGSKTKIGYVKVYDKEDKLNSLSNDLLKINLLEEIDSFD